MIHSKQVYIVICVLTISVLNVTAIDENSNIDTELLYQYHNSDYVESSEDPITLANKIPGLGTPFVLTMINHTDVKYDTVNSVSVDSDDNIFAAGRIESSSVIYGYVSKIKPNSEIEWTYFFEHSNVGGIAIDSQDNIIVAGITWNLNLSTTPGAFDRTHNSPSPGPQADLGDLFIAKLNSTGSIIWLTYLGGSGEESGNPVRIAVDSQDNIIIADRTNSLDFPTKNAIQENRSMNFDAIVCKFNATGGLLWSTFMGGTGDDQAESVALDQEDNIYVAGETNSLEFPVTTNGYQKNKNGGDDMFLTKFNPQGNITWSTFVGGNQDDRLGITVLDDRNNVYLLGATTSTDFPADNGYNGIEDLLLCKFNKQGSIIWSRYIGGNDDDVIGYPSAEIDFQGNIVIATATMSRDFPIKNAQFEENAGVWDGTLSSYSPSGELIWGTYIGGLGEDRSYDVAIDSQNRIIMGGTAHNAWSTITGRVFDPLEIFPKFNAFEYSFDDIQDGYLSKWENNGSLVWSTLVSVIPYPDADNDGDSLTNYEEYKLCYDSSLSTCTDPLNPDTDDDGLYDGYELDIGISPVIQDSDGDKILDGIEIKFGTMPNNTDTDGDQMDDYWEYTHMLDGADYSDANDDPDSDGLTNLEEYQFDTRLNPRNADTDNDTMSDGWEVENGLDPINDDRNLDNDNDDLSNLEEFDLETDPTDADTDGDGMPDGWEVEYGLNPLENDDYEDADNDGLDNLSEYQLRRLGFKPNSKTDVYLSIVLIVLAIGSIMGYLIWRRNRNINAKLMGYESYPDYKTSQKQGFSSAKERSNAIANGFLSKQIQNAVNTAGYLRINEMISDWDKTIDRIGNDISNELINQNLKLINETTSPLSLDELKNNLDPFVNRLNQKKDQLRKIISLQQLLITLEKDSRMSLIIGINPEELNQYLDQFISLVNDLDQHYININKAVNQREIWFNPWKGLLTLIQITEDGMPIELSRISEVVSCSETHAEELVKLLLSENKYIGEYDEKDKVYTKGVNIKDYIHMALSKLSDTKGN
jgi:hypothetical protein